MTIQVESAADNEIQLATFRAGELLLAAPIDRVQEINRNLNTTIVPHASDHIRGVINLRGEVATVIDLRCALGLPPTQITDSSRNLIVRTGEESIGLCVDSVADIITIDEGDVSESPANISGVDGQYFKGVYRTEEEIVVILDVDEVLNLS